MDKSALRKDIREAKKKLSIDDKLVAEQRVLDVLINDTHISKCQNLVAYWSMPDELPTRYIIAHFAQSKRIFLPVICGSTLEFRQFEAEANLMPDDKYGIGEPRYGAALDTTLSDIVVLVPGVAFTKEGHRLGRGGGYYDRILSQLTSAYKIGIAFQCQIVSEIPTESHDIMMNRIVCG